jgi:hypothetical protein
LDSNIVVDTLVPLFPDEPAGEGHETVEIPATILTNMFALEKPLVRPDHVWRWSEV